MTKPGDKVSSDGADMGRNQDSDLDIMAPEPRTVDIGSETIEVYPLKIGQLPGFMRCLRRTNIDLTSGEIDLFALVDESGEAVIEAVAIAVERPVETIQALAMDAFMILAAAVIEVNNDFFVQRLAPRMEEALKVVENTFSRNSSASSSAPDTRTIQ